MTDAIPTMKRVGILGGASDVATADYYRQINAAVNARLGGLNCAELLISSMNFAFCADSIKNGRWDELGAYLADRARVLEDGGCEAIMCLSNTLHRTAPVFMAGRSIPLIHIADPTGRAMQAAGIRRVALLGTLPVMSGDHIKARFRDLFGIATVVPTPDEQVEVDRIIFQELCKNQFTEASRQTYLRIVDRLAADGAEGVVLGCTEIPLLINQSDRPKLPMFDTTALHVTAAVDFALG